MYFPISVWLVLFFLSAMPNPYSCFQLETKKAEGIYLLLPSFFYKSARLSTVGYLYVCVLIPLKDKRVCLFNPLFSASSISLGTEQAFRKWRIHLSLGSCMRISDPSGAWKAGCSWGNHKYFLISDAFVLLTGTFCNTIRIPILEMQKPRHRSELSCPRPGGF